MRLGFTIYRRQRWWDKRLEAYENVLTHAHNWLVYYSRVYRVDGSLRDDSSEMDKDALGWLASMRGLQSDIMRYQALGRLYFSNEARELLNKLNLDLIEAAGSRPNNNVPLAAKAYVSFCEGFVEQTAKDLRIARLGPRK